MMKENDLRTRRKVLGLTQAALARELGVARNTVSRYELGQLAVPRAIALAVEALQGRAAR